MSCHGSAPMIPPNGFSIPLSPKDLFVRGPCTSHTTFSHSVHPKRGPIRGPTTCANIGFSVDPELFFALVWSKTRVIYTQNKLGPKLGPQLKKLGPTLVLKLGPKLVLKLGPTLKQIGSKIGSTIEQIGSTIGFAIGSTTETNWVQNWVPNWLLQGGRKRQRRPTSCGPSPQGERKGDIGPQA